LKPIFTSGPQAPRGGAGLQEEELYENPGEEQEAGRAGGITAIALYDYQAQAEDEISFDPNDIISNIEMVSRRVAGVPCPSPSPLVLGGPKPCCVPPCPSCPSAGGRGMVDRGGARQVRPLPRQLRGSEGMTGETAAAKPGPGQGEGEEQANLVCSVPLSFPGPALCYIFVFLQPHMYLNVDFASRGLYIFHCSIVQG
jgi:hypothetical protein